MIELLAENKTTIRSPPQQSPVKCKTNVQHSTQYE